MTTPSEVSTPPPSAVRRPVKAVFLVGFMGAGKTSVGQALSAALGWRFVDLDDRIVAKAGRSVAAIFQHDGEARFRQLEHEALRALLAELGTARTIVSLGGGAWMQSANAAILRESSLPVIFLDAPVEELWRRCLPQSGVRPLLKNETEFRQLYQARRASYEAGTQRVETHNHPVEEVAQQIALLLGLAKTNATT